MAYPTIARISFFAILTPLAAQDPGHAAWDAFRGEAGPQWTARWCAATGTPSAIFGGGLPLPNWRENSLDAARHEASALLRERHDLLGLGASEFREAIGAEMGRTWVLVYDQYFHGLPVIGGRADVRIHDTGKVSMFGSKAWPIAENFATEPAMDAATASAIAVQDRATAAASARARGSRLVIWGDVQALAPAPVHLAWEILLVGKTAAGGPLHGRAYVDARSGTLLHWHNEVHSCCDACCNHDEAATAATPVPAAAGPATGEVVAWVRDAASATSPLVRKPLAGLEVPIPGIGTVVTDTNGRFQVTLATPVSVTIALDGVHLQRIVGPDARTVTATMIPGQTTTFTFLNPNAGAHFVAHTSAYYWVDTTSRWARSVLGNTPQIDAIDNLFVSVNQLPNPGGGVYYANTIELQDSLGTGINNAAYSSIVAHEWGHALDDQYGGIPETDGLHEAWGDILSLYSLDYPLIAEDLSPAHPTATRNGNNNRQYPFGVSYHQKAEAFMGFAWNLRDYMTTTLGTRAAAVAVTNRIVVGSIVANASTMPEAMLEVFLADDDDGILANGTPNSADLILACNAHSLPYPGQLAPLNDECVDAVQLANGVNGPFTNVNATPSLPSWSCAPASADVWFEYVTGAAGTLLVRTCSLATFDTVIEVFAGDCGTPPLVGCNDDACQLQSSVSVPVAANTHYLIRVGGKNGAVGTFSLDVSGPQGVAAASTEFGDGCYETSTSFYEYFHYPAGFDLSGRGMALTFGGDHYDVGSGGTFVPPPPQATTLDFSTSNTVAVPLAGMLATPTGSTATVWVHMFGIVSSAQVMPLFGFYANPAAALLGGHTLWYTWHDFNANAGPGYGAVRHHRSGSIDYVTWDATPQHFGITTATSTWQLQFETATGNVYFAWQSMADSGHPILVGVTGGGAVRDLGSFDLSARLAQGFDTSVDNAPAPRLQSELPIVGTTAHLTTTDLPGDAQIGFELIGLRRLPIPVELTAYGMPGCRQQIDIAATVLLPVGNRTTTLAWSLPNTNAFLGLAVTAQTAALSPSSNTAGIVVSNGLELRIGS